MRRPSAPIRARAVLAAAAMLLAAQAAAMPADPPGADRPTRPEDLVMLRDFSRCVVDESPPQARRILALDYRTSGYRRSLRNLASESRPCKKFNGSLRLSAVLLAGGLAEALLPRVLAGQPLASRVAFDPSRPAIPARDEGEYLGLCAVRSMPAEVAALLATGPASPEEKGALAAIGRNLAPCLRAGASATLNRPGLRAILALAAYRIAVQSQPTPAGN